MDRLLLGSTPRQYTFRAIFVSPSSSGALKGDTETSKSKITFRKVQSVQRQSGGFDMYVTALTRERYPIGQCVIGGRPCVVMEGRT
jgi:hypothetical protein